MGTSALLSNVLCLSARACVCSPVHWFYSWSFEDNISMFSLCQAYLLSALYVTYTICLNIFLPILGKLNYCYCIKPVSVYLFTPR